MLAFGSLFLIFGMGFGFKVLSDHTKAMIRVLLFVSGYVKNVHKPGNSVTLIHVPELNDMLHSTKWANCES